MVTNESADAGRRTPDTKRAFITLTRPPYAPGALQRSVGRTLQPARNPMRNVRKACTSGVLRTTMAVRRQHLDRDLVARDERQGPAPAG